MIAVVSRSSFGCCDEHLFGYVLGLPVPLGTPPGLFGGPNIQPVRAVIYREAGQFRTSYAADQALFPIRQDRLFVWAVIIFAFLFVPFLASDYLLRAILVPFVILAIAAIGLNILVG